LRAKNAQAYFTVASKVSVTSGEVREGEKMGKKVKARSSL
jgi:hypothetical protein